MKLRSHPRYVSSNEANKRYYVQFYHETLLLRHFRAQVNVKRNFRKHKLKFLFVYVGQANFIYEVGISGGSFPSPCTWHHI